MVNLKFKKHKDHTKEEPYYEAKYGDLKITLCYDTWLRNYCLTMTVFDIYIERYFDTKECAKLFASDFIESIVKGTTDE